MSYDFDVAKEEIRMAGCIPDLAKMIYKHREFLFPPNSFRYARGVSIYNPKIDQRWVEPYNVKSRRRITFIDACLKIDGYPYQVPNEYFSLFDIIVGRNRGFFSNDKPYARIEHIFIDLKNFPAMQSAFFLSETIETIF